MFWNDPRNHDRLQRLSSTWEMDIFDSRSVQSLLAALQLRRTNLDALDRLAFMASFGKFTLSYIRHPSDRSMKTAAEALSRVLRTLNRRWCRYYRMGTTSCALVLPRPTARLVGVGHSNPNTTNTTQSQESWSTLSRTSTRCWGARILAVHAWRCPHCARAHTSGEGSLANPTFGGCLNSLQSTKPCLILIIRTKMRASRHHPWHSMALRRWHRCSNVGFSWISCISL